MMVEPRLTSVDRSTTTGQPTRGTPIIGAGDETTPTSQIPSKSLGTSSSAHPLRPPTIAGIDATNQILAGEPHMELEDPEKVDSWVEQLSQLVANLQQTLLRESLDKKHE
uniref:Uncharacterized protein n=1 Tax=Cannabis sativa TaxID=3483 RepID=A0A803PB75_CANSA